MVGRPPSSPCGSRIAAFFLSLIVPCVASQFFAVAPSTASTPHDATSTNFQFRNSSLPSRLLCANHKTGSVLMMKVHRIIEEVNQTNSLPPIPPHVFSWHCDGNHYSFFEKVAQIIRNPFNAVVSGLLYHAAGQESQWTQKLLTWSGREVTKRCRLPRCDMLPDFHFKRKINLCPHLTQDDFAHYCNALPRPTRRETYASYLSRLLRNQTIASQEAALSAEIFRFIVYELPLWKSTVSLRSSQTSVLLLDLAELERNLFPLTRRVLRQLEVPQEYDNIIFEEMAKRNISDPKQHSTR